MKIKELRLSRGMTQEAAAWDATWDAAHAVARDAALDAQVDMLTQMLREYVGTGEEMGTC